MDARADAERGGQKRAETTRTRRTRGPSHSSSSNIKQEEGDIDRVGVDIWVCHVIPAHVTFMPKWAVEMPPLEQGPAVPPSHAKLAQ